MTSEFNEHFFVQRYICDKNFMNIWSVCLKNDMSRTVETCPIPQCWRNLQKLPGSVRLPKFNL